MLEGLVGPAVENSWVLGKEAGPYEEPGTAVDLKGPGRNSESCLGRSNKINLKD